MQSTAPNTILNEHRYMDIFEPGEPMHQEVLVPIASTRVIQRPAAGGKSGGNAAGQLKDRMGSSNENDVDDDEDDPPVSIDKSKKSCFSRELAGLNGNLGSAREVPAGSHQRRSRTGYRCERSSPLEIASAANNWPVHTEALDSEWDLSFLVSWKDNHFGGALGLADYLGGAQQWISLFSLWFRLTVVIPPWRRVGQTFSAVINWC